MAELNLPPNNVLTSGSGLTEEQQTALNKLAFDQKKHIKSKITQTFNKAAEATRLLVEFTAELPNGEHSTLDHLFQLTQNVYQHGRKIQDWKESIDSKLRDDKKINAAENKAELKREILSHLETKNPDETLAHMHEEMAHSNEVLDDHGFDRDTASPLVNEDENGDSMVGSEEEDELDETQRSQNITVTPNASQVEFQDDSYRANTLGNRRVSMAPRMKTVFENSPDLKAMKNAHQDNMVEDAIRAAQEYHEHERRVLEHNQRMKKMQDEYEKVMRQSLALDQERERREQLHKNAKRAEEELQKEKINASQAQELNKRLQEAQASLTRKMSTMPEIPPTPQKEHYDGSMESDYHSATDTQERDQRIADMIQQPKTRPTQRKDNVSSTPETNRVTKSSTPGSRTFGVNNNRANETLNFEVRRETPQFSPIHNRSIPLQQPELTQYEQDLAMEYEENPDLHDTTEVKPDITIRENWPTLAEALTLLSFDGNPFRYASFIARFMSMVGDNPNLIPSMKLSVLEKALTGKAKSCISTAADPETALNQTLLILQEEYDLIDSETSELTQQISDLPFHQHDPKRMMTDLSKHSATFCSLEDQGATPAMMRQAKDILLNKLPPRFVESVVKYSRANPHASMIQYVRFIKEEILCFSQSKRIMCGNYPKHKNELNDEVDVYAYEDATETKHDNGPRPVAKDYGRRTEVRKETNQRPAYRKDYGNSRNEKEQFRGRQDRQQYQRSDAPQRNQQYDQRSGYDKHTPYRENRASSTPNRNTDRSDRQDRSNRSSRSDQKGTQGRRTRRLSLSDDVWKHGNGPLERFIHLVLPSKPDPKKTCVLCGPGHSALACPIYYKKVRKILHEEERCTNCGYRSHDRSKCRSDKTCVHCGGTHLSLGCSLREQQKKELDETGKISRCLEFFRPSKGKQQ